MNTEIRELNDAELDQIAGGKTWGDLINNTVNGLNATIYQHGLGQVAAAVGAVLAGQDGGAGPAGGGAGGAGPVA
jgi:hypothetical protein